MNLRRILPRVHPGIGASLLCALALTLTACPVEDPSENNTENNTSNNGADTGTTPGDDMGGTGGDMGPGDMGGTGGDMGPGDDMDGTGDDMGGTGDDMGGTGDDMGMMGLTPDPASSDELAKILANDAPETVSLSRVAVTYLKPAIASSVAGFTVQAEADGPAAFIEVDPTQTTPPLAVGDIVSFDVTGAEERIGLIFVTGIENLTRDGEDFDVSTFVQDIGSASDLVTARDEYIYESIEAEITVNSEFTFAGPGHFAAQVVTAGIDAADPSADQLEFRLPEFFLYRFGLEQGCKLTVRGTPLWGFDDMENMVAVPITQISVWDEADITALETCVGPNVQSAAPPSAAEVRVTFSRELDAASVDASKFTITPSLDVNAASVDGRTVTLTTGSQTAETEYTITVDSSVQDVYGLGLEADQNTATFVGYRPSNLLSTYVSGGSIAQVLLISEFHANPASVTDSNGEFIEIVNVTGDYINLNGLSIISGATEDITDDVVINPGERLLLLREDDSTLNGGLDGRSAAIQLSNSDSTTVTLDYNGFVIHSMAFDDAAPETLSNIRTNGPVPALSLQLDKGYIDSVIAGSAAVPNDWWCTTPEDAAYNYSEDSDGDKDYGTPGAPNIVCQP